jgi:peptidoglycan/LPS O-acetylase OafA/YrhL
MHTTRSDGGLGQLGEGIILVGSLDGARIILTRNEKPGEILFLYGIRGISCVYVLFFHLNYMIIATPQGRADPLYHRLTDWMRYGDFRVAAFFVISGYLLTLPVLRTSDWTLPNGVRAFMSRRFQRLLIPYYVALAISVVLYVAWVGVLHMHAVSAHAAVPAATATGAGHQWSVPRGVVKLFVGTLAHVALIHNLHPATALFISDPLWNVALEFQCYLLFAFFLLWVLRRFGPWVQLTAGAVIGLGPHFFLHGFLDWTRPWFITLYAMGVTVCALGHPGFPSFRRFERWPWGTIFLLATGFTVVAIVLGGIDIEYGDGWIQNLLLGAAISALLVYTRTGYLGPVSRLIRPVTNALENPRLCRLGRFSYSVYLIHFPILRLAVTITAFLTSSLWMLVGLSVLVYAPLTILLAYLFHLRFERPFAIRR